MVYWRGRALGVKRPWPHACVACKPTSATLGYLTGRPKDYSTLGLYWGPLFNLGKLPVYQGLTFLHACTMHDIPHSSELD